MFFRNFLEDFWRIFSIHVHCWILVRRKRVVDRHSVQCELWSVESEREKWRENLIWTDETVTDRDSIVGRSYRIGHVVECWFVLKMKSWCVRMRNTSKCRFPSLLIKISIGRIVKWIGAGRHWRKRWRCLWHRKSIEIVSKIQILIATRWNWTRTIEIWLCWYVGIG